MGEEEHQDQDQEVVEEPAPKRASAKAPAPRLPVRLIEHKGESALVEWLDEDGLYRRVYVPKARLDAGTVATADLGKGIPYGLPWEEWIEVTATPEHIANELRRQGVWEWRDMNNAALGAANRAFDAGAFLRRVQQEVDKT